MFFPIFLYASQDAALDFNTNALSTQFQRYLCEIEETMTDKALHESSDDAELILTKVKKSLQRKQKLIPQIREDNIFKIVEIIADQMTFLFSMHSAQTTQAQKSNQIQYKGFQTQIAHFLKPAQERMVAIKHSASPIEISDRQTQKNFLLSRSQKQYEKQALIAILLEELPQEEKYLELRCDIQNLIQSGSFVPFYDQRFYFSESEEFFTGTQLLGMLFDVSCQKNQIIDFYRTLAALAWTLETEHNVSSRMYAILNHIFEFVNYLPGMKLLTLQELMDAVLCKQEEFFSARKQWLNDYSVMIRSVDDLSEGLNALFRSIIYPVFRTLDYLYGDDSVASLMSDETQNSINEIFFLTPSHIEQEWLKIFENNNPALSLLQKQEHIRRVALEKTLGDILDDFRRNFLIGLSALNRRAAQRREREMS